MKPDVNAPEAAVINPIPNSDEIIEMLLPHIETGQRSPYPTVVNVTVDQYKAKTDDGKHIPVIRQTVFVTTFLIYLNDLSQPSPERIFHKFLLSDT